MFLLRVQTKNRTVMHLTCECCSKVIHEQKAVYDVDDETIYCEACALVSAQPEDVYDIN